MKVFFKNFHFNFLNLRDGPRFKKMIIFSYIYREYIYIFIDILKIMILFIKIKSIMIS